MGQAKLELTGCKSGDPVRGSGFILLEVLAAMMIMQFSILFLADLLLTSSTVSRRIEDEIQLLNAMRGEMEALEKVPLTSLPQFATKQYGDFTILIRVTKHDDRKKGFITYQSIRVTAYPIDTSGMRKYYDFVTFRTT